MKKLFPILLLSLFAFVACSDDDDDKNVELNNVVLEFIDSKYPGAKVRGSEYENNGLLEVEIVHENRVKELYFDSQSNWVFTSWDVRIADLPVLVKESVANAYPDYIIDEVDYVERPSITYYSVELEKGKESVMAYVSADGVILDSSTGEPGTKPALNEAVRSFISENYPNARIVEYEYTYNGLLEVDIVDGALEKEVYFDRENNWVQTDWDVPVNSLPDTVLNALAAAYPQYFTDSAEYVERPGGVVFYQVELEKGETEILVNVTPDGEILK